MSPQQQKQSNFGSVTPYGASSVWNLNDYRSDFGRNDVDAGYKSDQEMNHEAVSRSETKYFSLLLLLFLPILPFLFLLLFRLLIILARYSFTFSSSSFPLPDVAVKQSWPTSGMVILLIGR